MPWRKMAVVCVPQTSMRLTRSAGMCSAARRMAFTIGSCFAGPLLVLFEAIVIVILSEAKNLGAARDSGWHTLGSFNNLTSAYSSPDKIKPGDRPSCLMGRGVSDAFDLRHGLVIEEIGPAFRASEPLEIRDNGAIPEAAFADSATQRHGATLRTLKGFCGAFPDFLTRHQWTSSTR